MTLVAYPCPRGAPADPASQARVVRIPCARSTFKMTASRNGISLRGSLKLSLMVALISGLAGLVMLLQDVIIASRFAANSAADAYQLAISFPMLALNVFAGGTLLAILVPQLVKLDVSGSSAQAVVLIKQVRRALAWILFTVCALWALLYPHVSGLISRTFSADTLILSERLLWVVIPVLLISGLASIDTAVLNSRRRFAFISTLPAFMPAGVILGIMLFETRIGIYSAAVGLLFGSAMQWLAGRLLSAAVMHHDEHIHTPPPSISQFLRFYGMAAASAALLGGILMTDTFMASALSLGSTAIFSYSSRPVILLLAFATVVVGNVTLPFFSHLVAIGDWRSLKKQVLVWCGIIVLGAFPVMVLWHFNVVDIVALIYQRGAFSASDTAKVADVQQIYILQIPFYLVAMIGWRVMNSLGRHTAQLVITAACFAVNLAACLWLVPRLGLQGIAWATNLAFVLWALLIIAYLLTVRSSSKAVVDSGIVSKQLSSSKQS